MTAFLLALVLHVSSNRNYNLAPANEVICGAGTEPVLDQFGVIECESDYSDSFGSPLLSVGFGSPFNEFNNNGFGGRGFGFRGHGFGFGHHRTPCTPVSPATSCV